MTEKTEGFDFEVEGEAFHFRALSREDWAAIENKIKADAVRAWLATCEELGIAVGERRIQITEILARPLQVTLAHCRGVIEQALVLDKDREAAIEKVGRHGNTEEGRTRFVELCAFLYGSG